MYSKVHYDRRWKMIWSTMMILTVIRPEAFDSKWHNPPSPFCRASDLQQHTEQNWFLTRQVRIGPTNPQIWVVSKQLGHVLIAFSRCLLKLIQILPRQLPSRTRALNAPNNHFSILAAIQHLLSMWESYLNQQHNCHVELSPSVSKCARLSSC